jgi:hypothetical protein
MAMVEEGEKFKSILTGKAYQVRKINGKMVVLETENGASQVMTDKSNLKLFYRKEDREDEG